MRDESDEKELVLGNKQLLSIFFIVVAMLGVAFTLGYMIGRNTANVSAAGVGRAVPSQATPMQSPNPSHAAENPRSAEPADDPPPVPAAAEPAPEAPKQAKVTSTRAAKPYDSESAHAPANDTAAPPAPVIAPAVPGSGTYFLQVAAMKRGDADHMVSVLGERGFPAVLRDSSKEGLYRVLVGPYRDIPSVADAKAKLKAAGFDNPLIAH